MAWARTMASANSGPAFRLAFRPDSSDHGGSDRASVGANRKGTVVAGAENGNANSAIIIAGPTATGKSRLALAIAESLGGTIINADSMQVYRDLRVLTARPTPEDEARAPHALYGYVDASERHSVAKWRAIACERIKECRMSGAPPILVGGTGLYLKAMTAGLAEVPDIPQAVRSESVRLHGRVGGERFRQLLTDRDPSAARLPAGDSQRLIRAWEVLEATGRPLSDWQSSPVPAIEKIAASTILILPPRAEVYGAINARFRKMIDRGAIEEVEALMARGLDQNLPAMKAVGAPEIAAFLSGDRDLEWSIETATRNSRRYAKRQFTWFRHQVSADLTINEQLSEISIREIVHFIQDKGLTGNF